MYEPSIENLSNINTSKLSQLTILQKTEKYKIIILIKKLNLNRK